MKKILFVDDEEYILKSYKRIFSNSGYELYFAANGYDALNKIAETPIDLIISDMKMPGMTGYDLLKEVHKQSPQTIRLIMSGFSDKEDTLKIINDGTARAYLIKPWNNDELKQTVNAVFSSMSNLNESEFINLIEETVKLPVLPEVYQSILNLIKSDASIDKISRYVEQVPDYSARLLKIINSAFYGISTGSVKKAIVYLGLDTVKNIVLTSEIFDVFKDANGMIKEWQDLWDHSILCSKLFHGLYHKIIKRKMPEKFGAAGLLHDIGDLLILKHYPIKYKEILSKRFNLSMEQYISMEKSILGEGHDKIGGKLMEWWNLPQSLIDSCLYHHGPFVDRPDVEVYMLLHAADVLSHVCKHDSLCKEISNVVLNHFDINMKEFVMYANEIINE